MPTRAVARDWEGLRKIMRERLMWAVIATWLVVGATPIEAQSGPGSIRSAPQSECKWPPALAGGPSNRHSRFVEKNVMPALVEPGSRPFTLEARMHAYKVPGVSVAVIHNGKVDWARGWGVRDANICSPVTPDTVFQAASISKFVTALIALRLTQEGQLDLDRDANAYLRSWRLPPNDNLTPRYVTLRELLSHTAGLNVHGFPGYSVGASLPTVIQVLTGTPPAATEKVKIGHAPGRQWEYSGGGYLVTQLLLTDVSGKSFDQLAQQEVFGPLGLKRTAFAQPPTSEIIAQAASGHSRGKVIDGRYMIFPELGAAGLWTTPSDLARILIDVQNSAQRRRARLLTPLMAEELLTPQRSNWGLGVALYGTGPERRFGHDGANEGFQSTALAYVERGDGIVVFTNGDRGRPLADEIIRAVATDYGWMDLATKPAFGAAVPPNALSRLAGVYEAGSFAVSVDDIDGHLFVTTKGSDPERLIALSRTRFKSEFSNVVIEFDTGANGKTKAFRVLEGGPALTLVRQPPSPS